MNSILIVDDEPIVRATLQRRLSAEGYSCDEARNASEASERLRQSPVDLVILDIRMPGKSGVELLPEIAARYPDTVVVMATAVADTGVAIQCLKQGAYDYFIKPLNMQEVTLGVARALERRRLELENRAYRNHLEEMVADRTEELMQTLTRLRRASLDTIQRLAQAAEYRDSETGAHIRRIGEYCRLIAQNLGMSSAEIESLSYAAPLHDVGKIGVPDNILSKPGTLDPAEAETMRRHTVIGAELLKGSDNDIIQLAQKIALTHHERWDGSGYPAGLRGTEIPLCARIVAVADAFDALVSRRPYKPPYPAAEAFQIIRKARGTQFDPDIVDAFLAQEEKILAILREDKTSPPVI